jgi:hypothetical protein
VRKRNQLWLNLRYCPVSRAFLGSVNIKVASLTPCSFLSFYHLAVFLSTPIPLCLSWYCGAFPWHSEFELISVAEPLRRLDGHIVDWGLKYEYLFPKSGLACFYDSLSRQRPFVTFRNKIISYGEELLAPSPSWRTTPCRLSVTNYSTHSQLPSISGGHLLKPQPGGAPCRDEKKSTLVKEDEIGRACSTHGENRNA